MRILSDIDHGRHAERFTAALESALLAGSPPNRRAAGRAGAGNAHLRPSRLISRQY